MKYQYPQILNPPEFGISLLDRTRSFNLFVHTMQMALDRLQIVSSAQNLCVCCVCIVQNFYTPSPKLLQLALDGLEDRLAAFKAVIPPMPITAAVLATIEPHGSHPGAQYRLAGDRFVTLFVVLYVALSYPNLSQNRIVAR